ncbi:hypothetical protein HYPSUDRAFT_204910 [Hypholoma sublateritium FD-334 SS-4]|uniref:SET domain-containing protein n=1 Tax=Hypholoma sublateritium (strain FD-334 SS-4) TaxID=945553 RepID=A0A0D2M6Z1_HYPSF|nr:hypothetical protein HYPSUDRAFT_204910 [Hypholoma sublateritium FD-334 SS-4]
MSEGCFDLAKLAKEKGNIAFKRKDYAIARLLYTQAMEIDPSQYLYPLNSAIANLKLERWCDAESDATTALKLAPDNLAAIFRRGLARTELHHWSLARQDIQAFLDRGGSATEGHVVLAAITHLEATSTTNLINDRSSDSSEVFDNLPLDEISGFAVRDSKIGGKGVFATREFKRGDMILREKPLTTMTKSSVFADMEAGVRNMLPENLARFLSLHNAHTGDCEFPSRAAEIYTSNLLVFTNGTVGVGFRASRINHSCAPNVRHSFHSATGELRIYALGPIREGEEIFNMYFSGRYIYGVPRAVRQAELRMVFNFTCACAVCTLPTEAGQASDARRVRLAELSDRIPQFGLTEGVQRLRTAVDGVHLLREEGFLADADEFTRGAEVVCAYHSDWASAKYWAGVTYRTRLDEFGEGSGQVEQVREAFLEPKSIPTAGLGPQEDFGGIRLDWKA